MSKFKVGDKVDVRYCDEWARGCTITEVDGSEVPYRCSGVRGWPHGWWTQASRLRHATHPKPKARAQLEAVTKERDEARAENNSPRMRITKAEDTLVTKHAECAEGRLVADALRKERDEAREQLARVCAQVETLSAELKTVKAELTDEYNGRTNAMSECIVLRERCDKAQQVADGEATHNRILRNRIDELERFCSRDRRILDCMETLLGMRER